jgi:hypothetical protein
VDIVVQAGRWDGKGNCAEFPFNGDRVPLGEDEKMDRSDSCRTVCVLSLNCALKRG